MTLGKVQIRVPLSVCEMSTRRVIAAWLMTLDGIADWPVPREEDGAGSPEFWYAMYASYWDSVDTLLLGRRTYLKWADFWPPVRNQKDAEEYPRLFSEFAERVEKIVFSRTLETAPWEKSRLIRGNISDEVNRLRSQPGGNMLLGGGARINQAFLRLGLVDELRLIIFPCAVGRGKPLFDVEKLPDSPEEEIPLGAPLRHNFRLIEARPVKPGGGWVFLHYAAVRD